MIREQDLLEAIAECQGEKNPNANTCIKLAAYYTILDHINSNAETSDTYSHSNRPLNTITVNGDSEFLRTVDGLGCEAVINVMDDLMNAVYALAPKLYKLTMERLRDI